MTGGRFGIVIFALGKGGSLAYGGMLFAQVRPESVIVGCPDGALSGLLASTRPTGRLAGVHCTALVSPRQASYFFRRERSNQESIACVGAKTPNASGRTTGSAADVRPALLASRDIHVARPYAACHARRTSDGEDQRQKQKRPHPALRATFSQREKGKASRSFTLS